MRRGLVASWSGRGGEGLYFYWSEKRGVGLAPSWLWRVALAWLLVELERRLGSGHLLEVRGGVGLAPYRSWSRGIGLAHTGA